jgi:type I restriction enzyme S subunit
MSFLKYPAYKDSGVPWVGAIPADWNSQPLYAVASECDEPNSGMQETNLLSLSYGRIVEKDINSNDGLLPESFETYQIVNPSDIVLRLTDLQNDQRSLRSAIVAQRGIITSAYLAIRPNGVLPNFLSYLLRAFDTTKVFYSMGGGLRQSMKFADLKRLPVLIPPTSTQTAIATFLDHETAKIDALVAEQEKLIALLKEKRQAVISHAVTKGLDPSAPMKDTGVEWLGDVPEHWRVVQIKQFTTRISSGKTPLGGSETYLEEGVLFIRSQNVYDDGLRLDDAVFISEETDNEMSVSRVLPGDILLNITGASIGRTCLVPDQFQSANVNQHVCVVRIEDKTLRTFVSWVLKASCSKTQIELAQNGAAREGLNFDQIGRISFVLPPKETQLKVVEFLKMQVVIFDTLIAEAQRAIALLQERRTALISAAVTGQIDVRGVSSHPIEANHHESSRR